MKEALVVSVSLLEREVLAGERDLQEQEADHPA